MDMSKVWKNKETLEKEASELQRQLEKEAGIKAREENLINDTETLAEMSMLSMMENRLLREEVEELKQEIQDLKETNNGNSE